MTFYATPRRRATPAAPTVITETFTGADDSGWSSLWTERVTSLNSLAVIEANRGRITVNHTEAPPPVGETTTAYDTLGVFRHASPSNVTAFESSAGINRTMPGPILGFGGGGSTWDQRRSTINTTLDTWRPRVVTAGLNQLILSLRPWPDGLGAQLAAMAAGDFDGHYTTDAQSFVARGYNASNLVIRPMWEFNGGFYTWSIKAAGEGGTYAGQNGTATVAAQRFRDGWRRMVDRMRAVIPGLTFDWCPLRGQLAPARVEAAYPGDAYVNYIGIDIYNATMGTTDRNLRWTRLVQGGTTANASIGFQWNRDFAEAHGKKCSFAEWGVSNRTDGTGGDDDPVYIENALTWFDELGADGLLHGHCYFEVDAGDANHQLHNYPGNSRAFNFEQSRIAFDARMRG